MNKKIVTLVALLALGLAGCSDETTSTSTPDGSEPPTSTETDTASTSDTGGDIGTVYTAVTITNKEALTAEWLEGMTASRQISISTTPAGNIMTLISEGRLTVTSSDPTVVEVQGTMAYARKAGTATITVEVKNGEESVKDTVEITVTANPYATGAPAEVATPVSGETYRLGLLQELYGYQVFANGAMDGYYPATVQSYVDAAEFLVTEKDGQWLFQLQNTSNAGKYLVAEKSGTHFNVLYGTAEYLWDYNAEGNYFSTELDGTKVYLGTYGDNKTLSLSEMSHIEESTSYLAHLFDWDPEGTPITVTPADMTVTDTTISELAKLEAEANKLYRVTGIIEDKDPDDKYANGYLTDAASGDTIELYGIGTAMTDFVADGQAIVFNNPQVGNTDLADLVNGTQATLVVLFDESHSNFMSVLESSKILTDAKYAIDIAAESAESVTSDKQEAAYGETVTLTVTVPEGQTATVTVESAYGSKNIKADAEGKVTFSATCVNKVSKVVFEETAKTLEITPENFQTVSQLTLDKVVPNTEHPNEFTIQGNGSISSSKIHGITKIVAEIFGTYDNMKMYADGSSEATNASKTTIDNGVSYTYSFDTPAESFRFVNESTHNVHVYKVTIYYDGALDEGGDEPATGIDWDNPVEKTIAEVNSKNGLNTKTLYKFTGILEGLDHSDKYGNAYVTDSATGESVKLYGLVIDKSNFYIDEKYGDIKLNNPKTAVEDLADLNNGEEVTIIGVPLYWTLEEGNDVQICAYLEAHSAKADATYAITSNPTTNGTVSLSAQTATYGTVITITATPETGYRVDKVEVTSAFGKADVTKVNDTTYTFVSTVVNKVSVTFADASVLDTSMTITADALNPSGYTDTGSKNISVNGTDIAVSYHGIMKGTGDNAGTIQSNKGKDTMIWNTVAIPGTITSIVITYTTDAAADALTTYYGVSDAAYTAIPDDDVATTLTACTADQVEGQVVTIPVTNGGSYFAIARGTEGSAAYMSSIVINFTPAA